MPLDYLISALVTLVVVVDPVGLAPIFLAVTEHLPASARRRIAMRSSLIAGIILAGTALFGNWLLGRLGITLPAFRIAGGLLLFAVASEMVFGVRIERETQQAEDAVEEHVRNVAAFPLAIPLMAGPGAITATLLLAGQANGQAGARSCSASSWWSCRRASPHFPAGRPDRPPARITGNVVLSRLLGVMLAALAVQFVIDGVRAVVLNGQNGISSSMSPRLPPPPPRQQRPFVRPRSGLRPSPIRPRRRHSRRRRRRGYRASSATN